MGTRPRSTSSGQAPSADSGQVLGRGGGGEVVEGGLEGGVGRMPGRWELVAEPGALAAGVLAGADGGALDGFGQGQLAIEMGEGFGVADAAEGGEGAVVAPVAEAASFVKKACLEHLLGALGDALGEEFGFDLEAEDVGGDWCGGSGWTGRVASCRPLRNPRGGCPEDPSPVSAADGRTCLSPWRG